MVTGCNAAGGNRASPTARQGVLCGRGADWGETPGVRREHHVDLVKSEEPPMWRFFKLRSIIPAVDPGILLRIQLTA